MLRVRPSVKIACLEMKKHRRIGFLILAIAALGLAGCALLAGLKTYKNRGFGFAVDYPFGYKVRLIKTGQVDEGIDLSRPDGTITVRAMPAGTAYATMPFAQYVLIAAASEIQNFEKLESLTKFVSASGVEGYKTFWQVVETLSPAEQGWNIRPARKTVGPIYYFPPRRQQEAHGQPVKTIMISAYLRTSGSSNINQDLELIARSFRYFTQPCFF